MGAPLPMPVAAPPAAASRTPMIIAAMAFVAVLVAGVTFVVVNRNSTAAAGEIFLEPADDPGRDPFTTTIQPPPISITTTSLGGKVKPLSKTSGTARGGTAVPPTTPPTTAPTTTTTAGGGGGGGASAQVASRSGGAPGLYGGTQDIGRCDPAQLTAFLQTNPDQAAAWVQALNTDDTLQWSGGKQVTVAQISQYIAELTPLTLTADTRVTNYGFANKQPTPRQAVLQAGTAVLVDKVGVPRTKCACGNPLTKPVPVTAAPSYQGTAWTGWNPSNAVVVQQAPTPVDKFTIVNLGGDGYLERPAGNTPAGGPKDVVSTYVDPDEASGPPVSSAGRTGGEQGGGPGGGVSSSTETTETTETTRKPPSSSTVPPINNTDDYCEVARDTVERFDSIKLDDNNYAEVVALIIQYFEALEAAAPDDIKDDWAFMLTLLRRYARNPNTGPPPPGYQAASDRLEAHLESLCGIVDED